MADARRTDLDYVGAYNFKVEINGVTAVAFKSVKGLSCTVEVAEFQDGNDLRKRKRPAQVKYGDITLEKGYIANKELENCWTNTINGKYDRRDISIILYDNVMNEIVRWNCYECFPISWEINAFDGKNNDLVVETLKFATEEIKREG